MAQDKFEDPGYRFRARYLIKVLDAFARELDTADTIDPGKFRSKVLNPLLQRRLRGVPDGASEAVKDQTGGTKNTIFAFYLGQDPMEPRWVRRTLRQILYITSIRLSFALLFKKGTEVDLLAAEENTKWLEEHLGTNFTDDQRFCNEDPVWNFELQVIKDEGLEETYARLIDPSVGSRTAVLYICTSLTEFQSTTFLQIRPRESSWEPAVTCPMLIQKSKRRTPPPPNKRRNPPIHPPLMK